MAQSFKTLLSEDKATTRTLLHEAIPITGTIISGTYDEKNIKYFTHGMYEAVYDYPYLSSSANHIFDITAGYSSTSVFSGSNILSYTDIVTVQNAKKINVYNQMAQVLVGYDVTGNIKPFDKDGGLASGEKMRSCLFVNYSRLLSKDEIKKGSYRLSFYRSSSLKKAGSSVRTADVVIGDYGAQTTYKTNSPSGEYGLLYTGSDDIDIGTLNEPVGHIYYQAGIIVLTSSIFANATPLVSTSGSGAGFLQGGGTDGVAHGTTASVVDLFRSGTIGEIANALRFAYDDVDYNNTTELNSTIYFCRANNTEFNYSSNPTYLSASEIYVKGNNPTADPVSYITTVGLYSPDSALLAVAKLSEPLKKSPSNEITLRVRLDY